MRVLRSLLRWRDDVARKEDESVQFVLPNPVMIKITQKMPLDSEGLLEVCHPVPDLVRRFLSDVVKLIQDAREEPHSPFLAGNKSKQPMSNLTLHSSPVLASKSLSMDEEQAASLTASMKKSKKNRKALSSSPSTTSSTGDVEQDAANLYVSAGWIGPEAGPEGLAGVRLFDVTSLLESGNTSRSSRVEVGAARKADKSSLLFDIDTAADAPMLKARAEAIMQAIKNESVHELFQTQPMPEMEEEVDTSSNKKRTQPASPSNTSQTEIGEEKAAPATPSQPEIATLSVKESPQAASMALVNSPAAGSEPRSLRDIYKLSVRKRKKKERKGSSSEKTSDSTQNSEGSKKTKLTPKDLETFMSDIGWIADKKPKKKKRKEESAPPSAASSSSSSDKTNEGKGAVNRRKKVATAVPGSSSKASRSQIEVTPFDYSSASSNTGFAPKPKNTSRHYDPSRSSKGKKNDFGKVHRGLRSKSGNRTVTYRK